MSGRPGKNAGEEGNGREPRVEREGGRELKGEGGTGLDREGMTGLDREGGTGLNGMAWAIKEGILQGMKERTPPGGNKGDPDDRHGCPCRTMASDRGGAWWRIRDGPPGPAMDHRHPRGASHRDLTAGRFGGPVPGTVCHAPLPGGFHPDSRRIFGGHGSNPPDRSRKRDHGSTNVSIINTHRTEDYHDRIHPC